MTDQLQTLRNFIDGQWVDTASGATYEVTDPVAGQPYASAPLSGRVSTSSTVPRRPSLASTTAPGGNKERSGDPGRTPGTAEGDEETVEEDLRDKNI